MASPQQDKHSTITRDLRGPRSRRSVGVSKNSTRNRVGQTGKNNKWRRVVEDQEGDNRGLLK